MPTSVTSFGYLLPTRELVMAQASPDFQRIISLGEQAEALGFDSLWVGDSILARPRFEALTTLSALASRTQKVKLGTAVLLPALRNPVVLANQVAKLDLLSQGRTILGVGIGSKTPAVEREFQACGVFFSHRVGIFEEVLQIMRSLWNDEVVSFQGRHFQLNEVSLGLRPVQEGGVPFWMTGGVEAAQRRILRIGDGWLPNPATPEVFSQGWRNLKAFASESGKDAESLHRCVYTTLNINEDESQAEQELRSFMENYYGTPYETMARTQSLCAGTEERCITWLKDFVAAGAQTIVIRFGSADRASQLERCANDILPRVRSWLEEHAPLS